MNTGAAETCATPYDDDCNGVWNEIDAEDCTLFYWDEDRDGYGKDEARCRCAGDGVFTATNHDDCDDTEPSTHPGAADLCDGVDNDCLPDTADGSGEAEGRRPGDACDGADEDACAEGVASCVDGSFACDDTSGWTQEICGNVNDDDCDGLADAEDSVCVEPQAVADVDASGRMDGFDLNAIGRAFGSRCGDPGYDTNADLTQDCWVDGEDLALLASVFGENAL